MLRVNSGHIFRFTCFAAALFIIIGLFWGGTKPVAVGLFPGPLDKVAHFATFALIAALLWFSFQCSRPLLVIVMVSAIGIADEFHQFFLPGRSANMADMATDIFAAVFMVYLLKYARRRDG
jgi:VanZ family protein